MMAITTPTGHIGRQVLDLLLDTTDDELRIIVRDPGRLPDAIRKRADLVVGSHGDPAVVERAFDGVDAVFWVVPPDSRTTLDESYSGFTRPAVAAFRDGGVRRVVGVSALGRGTTVAGHAGLVTASLAMDDLIARSGVAYRALANPSFFENLLDDVTSIRDEGIFTDTVDADRRAPYVATRDIAAAAADLLLDRSWSGVGEVPLLGAGDLSPNDMAEVVTEVLGRPVRYRRQSVEQFRQGLLGYGLDPDFVGGLADMKVAKDHGLDAGVPRTRANTTPTSFGQWCEDTLLPAVRA